MESAVSDIDPDALVGSWTHLREQDSGDLVAFRPSDSPIPPARGRKAMDLVAGGNLRQFTAGADDRRVVSAGSWSLDGRELTLHTEGGAEERYEVERLTDKELVLRKGRSADMHI
jgi:hypothetical protein